MQLSKSDFMLFLKHPGWLWLKKHDPSKLPAIDEALQARFDDGNLFEAYADKLFPDAVRVGFSFQEYNYPSMPKRTMDAIKSGAHVILQGRLEKDNITCIFDVLKKVGNNTYDLYEIKSSTGVKEEHIPDLAFQTIVLESAGLKIQNIKVIHANKEYKRHGEIDIHQMTVTSDVTEQVRAIIDVTKEKIKQALDVMNSSVPPSFSPRHVGLRALDEWMAIYELLFPQKHTHNIYKLGCLNPGLIGELEDLGIKEIAEIPDSVSLKSKQHNQIKATKENKRIINKEKIKQFLEKLSYPLYFFDYETFCSVIPPFDGIRPYQQVPFQYSLHMIESPGGDIKHLEFLHTENSHPGLPLLQKLRHDIGNAGTIFVWYETFEKSRNKELGEMYPEYAEFMNELNERIVDLIVPFAENWFVDKDFFGSASIKKVYPVLVSGEAYSSLPIHDGGTASRTWFEMVLEGKYPEKLEENLRCLREYCCLDTLAMVQLFKFLESEVS